MINWLPPLLQVAFDDFLWLLLSLVSFSPPSVLKAFLSFHFFLQEFGMVFSVLNFAFLFLVSFAVILFS